MRLKILILQLALYLISITMLEAKHPANMVLLTASEHFSGADPAFWPRCLLDDIYITTRGVRGHAPPENFFKFEAL